MGRKGVNLWIDSTDFPLARARDETGRPARGKKSAYWSFKLNKPGCRYQFILDGQTRVVFLSHGYSPKLHDGQYVLANRPVLEMSFKGGRVVGDEHYSVARIIPDPSFVTPTRESQHLTQHQRKDNVQIRTLRSRVETPFAWLKTVFAALNNPWQGELEQHDFLVSYAVAIYNMVGRN